MQPLISVIIPMYKVELYLRKCIDSVLAQTYQNLEIILVDDGSPDGCGAICDEYAKKDGRVRVIHKENGGISDAKNVGIDLARGEYIGFVDSDDWIAPDMYERLYEAAKEYDAEIAMCEYYNVWSNKCSTWHHDGTRVYKGTKGMEALLTLEIGNYGWNKLYRRELWSDVRFPFGKIYEDVRAIYKVVQKCKTIVSISEIKYYYRRHKMGITGSNQIVNKIESVLSRIEKFEDVADDYPKQRAFMLKNTLEYIFPLRTAICEQGNAAYKDFPEDMKTVTEFLRQRKSEVLQTLGYGRLGRLSYGFMCRGDLMGWRLSRKVDQVTQLKGKIQKSRIVKKWKSLTDKIKRFGKLSYYYKWCMHLPLKEAVFMESRGGDDLAGNMFQLAQEICNRGIKVYLSVKDSQREKVESVLKTGRFYGLRIVTARSRKYYKALGTSRYWFTDMCFDYDAIKRPGQIYVNTWHGTPLKALEFDVKNQRHAMGGGPRDQLKCDYLAVPSRFLFETLLKASNVEPLFSGKALYCGYPRNSIFFDGGERQRIRTEKNIDGKEVFAYMPTWRESALAPIYKEYSLKEILDFFEETLKENQVIFVNLHNYTKEQIDYERYQKVFPFPKDVDTYTMLNAADCLITDYSSVFFDYANTRKKVVLFAYDSEEYLKNRGLYFELEDMPFPKVHTYEELARELNINKSYDDSEFIERFCAYDCADAAKKLLAVVMDGEPACETESLAYDGKKNILIYDARFMMREINSGPAKLAIEGLDKEEANYFYCYRQSVLKKTPPYLRQLPEGIRILTVTYNTTSTLWEKVAAKLSGGGNARVSVKREFRRQFGGKTFDEIWILDENEYDPFCRVLKEAKR